MRKTIEFALSEASIEKAIQELDAFSQWIEVKTKALNERLATVGQNLAAQGFYEAPYDGDDATVLVTAEPAEDGWIVRADGHAVAFIEFGAGVFFNEGNPYPGKRPPEVVGIGQYGKGYGKRRGWKYPTASGGLAFTRGNPASAPMFYAMEALRNEIGYIAREVFAD